MTYGEFCNANSTLSPSAFGEIHLLRTFHSGGNVESVFVSSHHSSQFVSNERGIARTCMLQQVAASCSWLSGLLYCINTAVLLPPFLRAGLLEYAIANSLRNFEFASASPFWCIHATHIIPPQHCKTIPVPHDSSRMCLNNRPPPQSSSIKFCLCSLTAVVRKVRSMATLAASMC